RAERTCLCRAVIIARDSAPVVVFFFRQKTPYEILGRTRRNDGVTAQPGGSRSIMAPGLTTRPPLRWGALPHEFAEIRRRANTGWGDRPAWSARIEGRPRPFGQDECRGKLPG